MPDPVRRMTADEFEPGQPTEGMVRETAFVLDDLWSGRVRTEPGATSGWHHHGTHDSVVIVVHGAFHVETADGLVQAGVGDFVHVPPHTVHRESNPTGEVAEVVIVRRGSGPVVINVDPPDV